MYTKGYLDDDPEYIEEIYSYGLNREQEENELDQEDYLEGDEWED